jgi:hypothetical protein
MRKVNLSTLLIEDNGAPFALQQRPAQASFLVFVTTPMLAKIYRGATCLHR